MSGTPVENRLAEYWSIFDFTNKGYLKNLKNFRKNSKMSQEVKKKKVGVSRQAVSRWEVGEAYPEMSNIVALCSIFHCNINDLINDNIVDIESFDKETQDSIVKFKKEQQKRMKGLSKAIYIITLVSTK